ncbi:MAG TPA: NUDIX hydrolase [Hansschlegelia sp.]
MSPEVVPTLSFGGRVEPEALDADLRASAAIDAHWARAKAANSGLFNGRVMLASSVEIVGGRLEARFHETGYATYLWLRAGGNAAYPTWNVFSAAAVVTSDGAVLLGRMAPHTATAGQIYFPAGTPDRDDLVGDRVDLEGSLARELMEETGLGQPIVRPTETRFVVIDRSLYACMRRFDTDLDAATLAGRVEAHFLSEERSELDQVALVRSMADLTDASPPYVHAAIAYLLRR